MRRPRRLQRSFYNRPTLIVAEELIGKYLVYRPRSDKLSCRIVEVEAYIGEDDPASHAAPGPTKRNAIMYGPAGYAYIYFIYGMYNCLNVVTEGRGFPAAVLIRAAEPVEGIEIMATRSGRLQERKLLSGPGRLCRALGLTTRHSGTDLCGTNLWIEDRGEEPALVVRTPRIGIRKGIEHHWRFGDANSESLSAPVGSVKRKK